MIKIDEIVPMLKPEDIKTVDDVTLYHLESYYYELKLINFCWPPEYQPDPFINLKRAIDREITIDELIEYSKDYKNALGTRWIEDSETDIGVQYIRIVMLLYRDIRRIVAKGQSDYVSDAMKGHLDVLGYYDDWKRISPNFWPIFWNEDYVTRINALEDKWYKER